MHHFGAIFVLGPRITPTAASTGDVAAVGAGVSKESQMPVRVVVSRIESAASLLKEACAPGGGDGSDDDDSDDEAFGRAVARHRSLAAGW